MLKDKRVVVTGGTGSLGKVLVRRLLSGEVGLPEQITVFSRDEAKQHSMRLAFERMRTATDEVIYHNFERLLRFRIGDVRDPHSVSTALRDADVVFNAAALKQVPSCEYFPFEAVQTNVVGAENIIRAGRGETYIPRVPSAKVTDIAAALIGERKIETQVTGIRPGEKVHEILVSEEEAYRTIARGDYYVIKPMLPELRKDGDAGGTLRKEYSSADDLMNPEQVGELLKKHKLMVGDRFVYEEDMLA